MFVITWKPCLREHDLLPQAHRWNVHLIFAYELTKPYENDEIEHDIKLIKGKLEVDGIIVDQNMFFQ